MHTILFSIALLLNISLFTEPLTLILNSENTPGELPRNFRNCQKGWGYQTLASSPSSEGLDQLKASGSGQFSENGLQAVLKQIPANPIIVDLRQESHGFVNGIAISWYGPRDAANAGKDLYAIEQDEQQRLQELLNHKEIAIHRIISKPQDVIGKTDLISIVPEKISTEKNLTANYFRLPIIDHLPPSQESVDKFLAFVNALPQDAWLHFHCEAGHGRTTTFLVMYDILRNAKKVSFDDIIQRQHLLGGMNLAEMPPQSQWKYTYAVERLNFLKKFYDHHRQDISKEKSKL